jgi:hypothetical protein
MNKAFILGLLLTGCAVPNAPETSQAFVQASAADVATTSLVIGSGAGIEANPVGFLGSTVVKAGIYLYAKDLPEHEQKQLYKAGSSLFSGAAVNNLLVLLGASTGLSILSGLLSSLAIFKHEPAPHPVRTAQD